ncbi:MAG: mono/diheme cytochrome c family protein [Verrucomicrobiales bacterium]|jgi:mono/diheme cytochrome c family protein
MARGPLLQSGHQVGFDVIENEIRHATKWLEYVRDQPALQEPFRVSSFTAKRNHLFVHESDSQDILLKPASLSSTTIMIRSFLSLSLFASLFHAGIAAAEPDFGKDLQPFLEQHCLRCHGEKKQKGDLRIDQLSQRIGFEDTTLWAEVMERISSGEMPPVDEENLPSADEGAAVVEWLAARIKEGESARMAQRDRVSYHRLTREEYVYTMFDLIGVQYDAEDPGGLLENPEWNGFERLGSVLTLSPTHVEKYITAAEIVLAEAYPEKPIEYVEGSRRIATISPEHQPEHYERLAKQGLQDKVRKLLWASDLHHGGAPWNADTPYPGPGVYEFSYTMSGLKAEGKAAPRFQAYVPDLDRVLFEQDVIAPEDKPITLTFRAHFPSTRGLGMHLRNSAGSLNQTHRSARHGRKPFVSFAEERLPWQMKIISDDGEPLHSVLILDSMSVRGPIISDEAKQWRITYMPTEEGNMDQVRASLGAMATRAFRRPLYDGELDFYVKIVEAEMAAGEPFVNAVKTAMIGILCSKSFLFIAEGDPDSDRHTLGDWEIASRLSYLLWSTMPDAELFAAAEQGKLRDQAELKRQVARMLADDRSERFTESFASQWLHLRKVGMFPPDKKIYPNYDQHLEDSMVGETQEFFREVLHQGLTLREFIDSDWTMLNPRLASFYGVPNIAKDEFQRVSLSPEQHRGGLLTQAAILSLTSDGTRHRPVHRGAWLSEAILGKTPPPPPANVDPIEPNPVDSPKATLRMKLDAHKHDPNCASCHKTIDPLGLAFDNYNAIGEWRTHEQVTGTGEDPLVDASGELPDGRTFQNAKEFQQLLMADLDRFNEAFIEKLAIYGLRRTMTFEDREELEAIARVGRESDYRVRDIVEAFVLSELFQKR